MKRDLDWERVDLVVFDVDGTLYDQRKLRMRVAFDLLKSFDARAMATIFAFRRTRERLGEAGDPHFLSRQFELVSARLNIPVEQVHSIIAEWIEERPLSHLGRAKVPGVGEVFRSLRGSGRRVAVFSDYPAQRKLAALGLSADLVVSSTDADIARLKPDPAGLRKILQLTGVSPSRSLMIGDRADRDGVAANSAGMSCMLRTRRPATSFATFRTFRDEIFAPLLQASDALARAPVLQ